MKFIPLLGRILFSAVFILFGFGHFTETANMVAMAPDFLPATTLFVYLTGIVSIAGGVMVLIGFRARLGGLMLALFMFSTSLFIHSSGFAAGDQVGTANFMKDLALAGAGLLIWHFGSGPMSVDSGQVVSDEA